MGISPEVRDDVHCERNREGGLACQLRCHNAKVSLRCRGWGHHLWEGSTELYTAWACSSC